MNEAQFLLDLGMLPVPLYTGLPCPAIGHRDPILAYDSEMDGYAIVKDLNGQSIPDISKSYFAKGLKTCG